MSMLEFTDMQSDALKELCNIAVGRASRSISQLLLCEMAMSAPLLMQVSASDATGLVDGSLRSRQDVCSVIRNLSNLPVSMVMIFQGPHESIGTSLSLGLVPDGQINPSCKVASLIATLITDSCARELETVLGFDLGVTPTSVTPGIPEPIFDSVIQSEADLIILKIDIALQKRAVSGHLLLSFQHDAVQSLGDALDRLIAKSEGF